MRYLDIKTELVMSSSLNIEGKKEKKLMKYVKNLNVKNIYLHWVVKNI